MKILFLGDSITDMGRRREYDNLSDTAFSYGVGYPLFVAGELHRHPDRYEVINRGISGDESVNLYARVCADVWSHEPDVLSILIGINDLWHQVSLNAGVDLERYIKTYKILLDDTKKRLPNVKLILCEPFMLKGCGTEKYYEHFKQIAGYAAAVKQIAEEYGAYFLPLQQVLSEATARAREDTYLYDGIHPTAAGAKLIADEWLKLFKEKIDA
ncbi:MAG: SGNH/GDSL hydrolase family protein [Clostridia bacterium]|nr:SGNH/GDSL hydrolase family protein [Clostridia bacterium]